MQTKKALIFGAAGQDGSFLSELLVEKKYEVFRFDRLHSGSVRECDVKDFGLVQKLVREIAPDEIYHLAAVVNPLINSETEFTILHDNLVGFHNVLRAVKENCSGARIFFAGSSLMFGKPKNSPQNEETAVLPDTPYGISKAAGFFLAKMYRESFGIFVCTGILYNHESPRRGLNFLPKKITHTVAEIKKGRASELRLGNLDAVRDWGFAGDYVEAMWLMLQQEEAEDYVIGTGEAHTVKDILDVAFHEVGLDWKEFVFQDPQFMREKEEHPLIADISKITKKLGWRPKISFYELIISMVREDMKN